MWEILIRDYLGILYSKRVVQGGLHCVHSLAVWKVSAVFVRVCMCAYVCEQTPLLFLWTGHVVYWPSYSDLLLNPLQYQSSLLVIAQLWYCPPGASSPLINRQSQLYCSATAPVSSCSVKATIVSFNILSTAFGNFFGHQSYQPHHSLIKSSME